MQLLIDIASHSFFRSVQFSLLLLLPFGAIFSSASSSIRCYFLFCFFRSVLFSLLLLPFGAIFSSASSSIRCNFLFCFFFHSVQFSLLLLPFGAIFSSASSVRCNFLFCFFRSVQYHCTSLLYFFSYLNGIHLRAIPILRFISLKRIKFQSP